MLSSMPFHSFSTVFHSGFHGGGPIGGLPTPEVWVSSWWMVAAPATSGGKPSRCAPMVSW
jgi:hypothetical protein